MKTNEVYLGDAYTLIKEIEDNSVDLIYTDIPYLYDACSSNGKSELSKRINKIAKEDIVDISSGIDYKIFDEFLRVLKKLNIFIWCSKLQIKDIINYFTKNSKVRFEILVWCKTNPTPAINNTWLPNLEYCLYFKEPGVIYNKEIVNKSKFYLSSINKYDKDLYNHPTIKPLPFVEKNILHVTQVGDVVLDPFCGSGTTLVACKETGRKYIGFEINEEYYNACKDRLKGITQKERKGRFEQLNLW